MQSSDLLQEVQEDQVINEQYTTYMNFTFIYLFVRIGDDTRC